MLEANPHPITPILTPNPNPHPYPSPQVWGMLEEWESQLDGWKFGKFAQSNPNPYA